MFFGLHLVDVRMCPDTNESSSPPSLLFTKETRDLQNTANETAKNFSRQLK